MAQENNRFLQTGRDDARKRLDAASNPGRPGRRERGDATSQRIQEQIRYRLDLNPKRLNDLYERGSI